MTMKKAARRLWKSERLYSSRVKERHAVSGSTYEFFLALSTRESLYQGAKEPTTAAK